MIARAQDEERSEDARNRQAYNTAALTGQAMAGKLKDFDQAFPKLKILSPEKKAEYKRDFKALSEALKDKGKKGK